MKRESNGAENITSVIKRRAKKILSVCIAAVITAMPFSVCAFATEYQDVDLKLEDDCRSAILMEAQTGKILYEQNADEALPPASVTKVMTLLLVMEAIEAGQLSLDDTVTASANACSMGGSQIYLEEGEQMTAEDMLKSVIIASANDAAVALAEHVCGTEEAFVEKMNKRAKELGMTNTSFENTNGLDDTTENHVTSARDIAIMSRELLKHEKITEYSSIWQDTIRNGEFTLTNTNRLVRFYNGATGLKTGSTSKAGFCISATATRDGMSLICVIMGADSRDIRNAAAVSLLDWGFANYAVYRDGEAQIGNIPITGGILSECSAHSSPFFAVVNKADIKRIECTTDMPDSLAAPIYKGDVVGYKVYSLDGKELGKSEILADENVEKIGFSGIIVKILRAMSFF